VLKDGGRGFWLMKHKPVGTCYILSSQYKPQRTLQMCSVRTALFALAVFSHRGSTYASVAVRCTRLGLQFLPKWVHLLVPTNIVVSAYRQPFQYDLRSSRLWLWRWQSSGLQRCVDWYEFTKVSAVNTASIIRAMSKPGARGQPTKQQKNLSTFKANPGARHRTKRITGNGKRCFKL
jgi:hypothetical protein